MRAVRGWVVGCVFLCVLCFLRVLCANSLSQLLVQRYKINQRVPNNRAKITEKSEKCGFCYGRNMLTIRQIRALVKG